MTLEETIRLLKKKLLTLYRQKKINLILLGSNFPHLNTRLQVSYYQLFDLFSFDDSLR
jgi:hypothetical protein